MKTQPARPPLTLLLTVAILACVEFMHAGMVAFGASPIIGDIAATPEQFSLAAAGYASVAIVTIAKQRWLVERMGWRLYVQASVGVFILGCLICGSSEGFQQFLIGRCVMGLGGASFMTAGRTMIHLMPGTYRFRGIRFFATGLALGIAIAPGLAAFAVSSGSSHGIFSCLAGAAAIAGLCASLSLPADRVPHEHRSHSHVGLILAILGGSFLLLYGMQRAQYDYYGDALVPATMALAGIAAIGSAVCVLIPQHRPLIDLRGLTAPRYIAGVALFTLCYLLLGANNYVLPQFLQKAMGFDWYSVGRIQSFGLSSTIAAWFLMAWLLPRSPGARKFFVAGFGGLAVFGFQLARQTVSSDPWTDIVPALAANGVFLIFVLATTAIQTFRDVQHNEAILSHAQQFKNMLAQFGMAAGLAIAAVGLQSRTALHYSVLNNRVAPGEPAYDAFEGHLAAQMSSGISAPQATGIANGIISQLLSQHATMSACVDYFAVIACIGVIGAIVMASQRLMR